MKKKLEPGTVALILVILTMVMVLMQAKVIEKLYVKVDDIEFFLKEAGIIYEIPDHLEAYPLPHEFGNSSVIIFIGSPSDEYSIALKPIIEQASKDAEIPLVEMCYQYFDEDNCTKEIEEGNYQYDFTMDDAVKVGIADLYNSTSGELKVLRVPIIIFVDENKTGYVRVGTLKLYEEKGRLPEGTELNDIKQIICQIYNKCQ